MATFGHSYKEHIIVLMEKTFKKQKVVLAQSCVLSIKPYHQLLNTHLKKEQKDKYRQNYTFLPRLLAAILRYEIYEHNKAKTL